jgi:uncharacterized protein (TIGR03083 family)
MSAESWDAMNPASKSNLLRVVREEAAGMLALASPPENWQAPTASGHWQVRDIIGHMVDVTEGYLEAFRLARSGAEAPAPHGLRIMGERLDQAAQAFRSVPQAELLERLQAGYEQVMGIFEALTNDEWTGLIAPHPYMGPIPAFFYPTFQLVDYGVHGWDIREGLKLQHGLTGDTADFLAPIMFILWQATTDISRVGGEPITVGIRVSGRSGGLWKASVSSDGYGYEKLDGDGADLPAILDFDAASLVLTAYGRIRGGASYGDHALADRYRSLFFAI